MGCSIHENSCRLCSEGLTFKPIGAESYVGIGSKEPMTVGRSGFLTGGFSDPKNSILLLNLGFRSRINDY